MEIVNNSTIDSVIDYANVKFGLELERRYSRTIKRIASGDTLKLIDPTQKEDNDTFPLMTYRAQ